MRTLPGMLYDAKKTVDRATRCSVSELEAVDEFLEWQRSRTRKASSKLRRLRKKLKEMGIVVRFLPDKEISIIKTDPA
jgi:hypothetical protein